MSRFVMAGFELGDTLAYGADTVVLGPGTSPAGTTTLVTSTPAPRSGTYSFKAALGASGGTIGTSPTNWPSYARKQFSHAVKTDIWYAFGFLSHQTMTAMVGNAGALPMQPFFVVRDAGGNVNCLLSLDQGAIRAYYASGAGNTPNHSNMTIIGSPVAISADTWHLIEVHVIAATTATGTFALYVDGTLAFTATSQRTAQTTASMASFDLGYILSGCSNSTGANINWAAGGYYAFDDVRINDTSGTLNNGRPGDGAIRALIPNGVGSTIGGTPLTGVPGSPNWQNVDELPPSTTDYNAGTTVGTGELYTLTDPPSIASCAAVNVIVQAFNSDAGGGSIGITLNSGGSTNEGTAQPITTTAAYYNRLLENDPSDSAAWSQTKLTALQAGITVR